jgi:hypothetical protein
VRPQLRRAAAAGVLASLIAFAGTTAPLAAPSQSAGAPQTSGTGKQKHPAALDADAAALTGPAEPTSTFSYSTGQLTDHLYAVRWELAAVAGTLAFIGIQDWDWGGSEFRFIEEGWFGSNTRHGGMDKIGHAFSTFVIADILTERIQVNATNPAGAPLTGALVAFGIMGLVETLDGFTGRHRFSREDIVANGAGAAFALLRNAVPGLKEKLDWRIMYTPASFERPGVGSDEEGILPPYERQRFIMALKGSGFEALKTTPLRFAELHVGFDARGFSQRERELGYPIERNLYVGVGLNLNEVLFGAGLPNLSGYRNTLPGYAVRKTLEYVQVPYTAVYRQNTFSRVRRLEPPPFTR